MTTPLFQSEGDFMKKLIIWLSAGVLVFALIAVSVTYFLIQNAVSPLPPQTVHKEALKGIDLNGTYDQNDLLFEEVVISESTESRDAIIIPRIKGLKDLEVQEKINNDIRQKAQALIDEHPDANYANFYVYSSFANVISLTFNIGFDEEPYYEMIYFNYNLTDGSALKLEDLFMPDTDLVDLIRSSFYTSMSLYGNFDTDTYVTSPNEEVLYKTVKAYLNSDNKQFAFTPARIYFYSGDFSADVSMMDIPDKVCIYSKYMTEESIFTGEFEGYKNIFTCADSRYDLFDMIEYGLVGDNLWYDITAWMGYGENPDSDKAALFESFKEEIYQSTYETLEEYKTIAKDNPDKFYILLVKPSVNAFVDSEYTNGEWITQYSDMATVYKTIQVFEMPMKTYDTVYREKIKAAYRYEYFAMAGGVYLDTEASGVDVTEISESSVYNFVTREELTELEDVFYLEDEFYSYVEERVRKSLSYSHYSQEEIDRFVSEINLTLDGERVVVTIECFDQFEESIYLSSFDKSLIRLF